MALQHIARSTPPWRTGALTECGRAISKLATLTRGEFIDFVNNAGNALNVCSTCFNTARTYNTWEQNPASVIQREIWRGNGTQTNCEFLAIADLIAAHRSEFVTLVGRHYLLTMGNVTPSGPNQNPANP